MASEGSPGNLNQPKIFEASPTATAPDGWLGRNGVFYACATDEHDECAHFLLNSQKELIRDALYGSENPDHQHLASSLRYEEQEYPSRMILQAAGFALLSSNQFSETNLPDTLSFPQMEFATNNHIALMPPSGQLDYQDYQAFLDRVKDWEEQAQTGDLWLPEDKRAFARQMTEFLKDPTGIAYFMEKDSAAKAFYETLTVGFDAEVSARAGKDLLLWRHLPLPSSPDVFLELDYHNHGFDSYPLTETWVKLVTKRGINNFLDDKNKRPAYRCVLSGDLSILK